MYKATVESVLHQNILLLLFHVVVLLWFSLWLYFLAVCFAPRDLWIIIQILMYNVKCKSLNTIKYWVLWKVDVCFLYCFIISVLCVFVFNLVLVSGHFIVFLEWFNTCSFKYPAFRDYKWNDGLYIENPQGGKNKWPTIHITRMVWAGKVYLV